MSAGDVCSKASLKMSGNKGVTCDFPQNAPFFAPPTLTAGSPLSPRKLHGGHMGDARIDINEPNIV